MQTDVLEDQGPAARRSGSCMGSCIRMVTHEQAFAGVTCYLRVTVFCRPQSQALTRRAWTHGRAVKPVCAVLRWYMMLAESGC